MRKYLLLFLLGVVGLFWASTHLGRRGVPVMDTAAGPGLFKGGFHIHSKASHDGKLSLEEITRSAQQAGLSFIVLTDHNALLANHVRLNDVWVIPGSEVSTPFGHLIQLGGRDQLADADRGSLLLHQKLKNLGALSVPAHPSDPKRPWEGPVDGIDGIEIANASSTARHLGGPLFLGLLSHALSWKPNWRLSLTQFYFRDQHALAKWDGELSPSVAGYCGLDAHGTYLDFEKNLSLWHLVLRPETGSKMGPRSILRRLARGEFYCAAGLFGELPRFLFYAQQEGGHRVYQGGMTALPQTRKLVAKIEDGGTGFTLALLRNGEELLQVRNEKLVYKNPTPGTYRVEVRMRLPRVWFGDFTGTVIYSNRIRIATEEEFRDFNSL